MGESPKKEKSNKNREEVEEKLQYKEYDLGNLSSSPLEEEGTTDQKINYYQVGAKPIQVKGTRKYPIEDGSPLS